MDSVNKLRSRNYLISYSFLTTFIFVLGFIYFFLKNNFQLSDQELVVWRGLSNIYIDDGGYNYFLSYGPIAFNNLVGVLMKLTPSPSFIFPHLVSFSFFILVLNIQLDKASTEENGLLTKIFAFILLCLTPSSLFILLYRPIEIILIVAIWMLNRGLNEVNTGSLGRGIFLTAISSAFIFLMGQIGISYLMAFISLAPFLVKPTFFKDSPYNGYLVIFLPSLMAAGALFYLSWLYQRDLVNFLFLELKSNLPELSFLKLIPFVFFLFLNNKLDFFSQNNRTLTISALAFVLYYLLGIEFEIYPFIGLVSISLALEIFDNRLISLKHIIVVSSFVILSWVLLFPPSLNHFMKAFETTSSIQKETWPEINNRLQDNSLKTIIIGENYSQYFIGIKRNENILTPDLTGFKQYQKNRNLSNMDRIIVEQSHWEHASPLSHFQNSIYFNPPKEHRLTFDSGNWRIYVKKSMYENPPIYSETEGNVFNNLEKPLSAWFDVLSGLVIITILLLGRMFFYDKRSA